MARTGDETFGFPTSASLGLVGHGFLLMVFQNPEWSNPPWPALGALLVMTLAASTTALFVGRGVIHAAAVTASALITAAWAAELETGEAWALVSLVIGEGVIAYSLVWLWITRRLEGVAPSVGALAALFIGELTLIAVSALPVAPPLAVLTLSHVVNLSLILWLSWQRQWQWIGLAAVLPAWLATAVWQTVIEIGEWTQVMTLATSLYAVFAVYPFVLGNRARESRDPY